MKCITLLLIVSFLSTITICESGIFNHGKPPGPQQRRRRTLIHVDSQNIIRLICKHAGMVLPEHITRDLEIISSVCECDDTSLDLIHKELRIQNIKIVIPKENGNKYSGLKEERAALSIGTLCLSWDSYLRPCIDIEVENVNILVEFINLILTKNNWNTLKDKGFPPKFKDLDDGDVPLKESTFIRIGGIRLIGEIKLKLRSKPLDQDLVEDIVFDLRKIAELSNQIRRASDHAKDKTGRRGLKTEELYEIIYIYFNEQIQQLVKIAATDLALGAINRDTQGKTVRDAKKLLGSAVNVAMKYSKNVGDKADEQFGDNLMSLGVGAKELDQLRNAFKSSADNLFRNGNNDTTSDDSETGQ